MDKINKNIYSLRKQNKMSMEELGKRINVSKQTIQKYESGEIKNIPYDKILALANVLDVSPIQLMGWKTDEEINEQLELNSKVALKDAELVTKFHKLSISDQDIIMSMINSLLKTNQN